MEVVVMKQKVKCIGDCISYNSVVALSFEMNEWP